MNADDILWKKEKKIPKAAKICDFLCLPLAPVVPPLSRPLQRLFA